MPDHKLELQPIGWLRTPYTEKFGTPRQPGLVPCSGYLHFAQDLDVELATRELDQFSHIWLIFWFDRAPARRNQPLVRPPRLGGNRKVGVFASRSPFRPNPLGLSLVRHHGLIRSDQSPRPVLEIEAPDLVDGTPVLDIKPYLSWSDSAANACGGFAPDAPTARFEVTFENRCHAALSRLGQAYPEAKSVIAQVLAQDPRPAYRRETAAEHGIRLFNKNIRYQVQGRLIRVLNITD